MPEPSPKTSLRTWAWEIRLCCGTLRVSPMLPPIVEPRPIVMRPRMVAPE